MSTMTNEQINHGAESFIQSYYTAVDKNRDKAKFYFKDSSSIRWNGYVFNGKEIEGYFTQIPGTSHEITSIDAQCLLLPKNNSTTAQNILVTTNGYVEYGVNNLF
eukprot:gene3836-6996_t